MVFYRNIVYDTDSKLGDRHTDSKSGDIHTDSKSGYRHRDSKSKDRHTDSKTDIQSRHQIRRQTSNQDTDNLLFSLNHLW